MVKQIKLRLEKVEEHKTEMRQAVYDPLNEEAKDGL